MKYLSNFLLVGLYTISLQAQSYIVTEGGVTLPLKQQHITLYNGIPVSILSQQGTKDKIQISGYLDKQDPHTLYATKNLKLLLATVKNPSLIKRKGHKGELEALVLKVSLTEDMEEAWEENSNLFYDKCTKCHHAKIIEHHTMQEWEALYGSMKEKARTVPSEDVSIMRFLRAFAKDGILRESE